VDQPVQQQILESLPVTKEIGEIVQVQLESNASTSTQPTLKPGASTRPRKAVQIPRPAVVVKPHNREIPKILQQAKVPQPARPVPTYVPAPTPICEPSTAISQPVPPLAPAEMVMAFGPEVQVAAKGHPDSRKQAMEEDMEGWRGTGDVEMAQREEEWAQFDEQHEQAAGYNARP
jgi:hypothetical protein